MSQPKPFVIKHSARCKITEDGRSVEVNQGECGGFMIDWYNPGNGSALESTRVFLTEEAVFATVRCVMAIIEPNYSDDSEPSP